MPEESTSFQDRFRAGLLSPQSDVPVGVIARADKKAVKRYAVYRNNVTASLLKSLGDIFPATLTAMGESAFEFAALAYLRASPPTSKRLWEFGQGFESIVGRIRELAHLPWLPDLARLERDWLDAYHSADAAPLQPQTLGAVPPEQLGAVVMTRHPAARLRSSRFPLVSILGALRAGTEVGNDLLATPAQHALVTRPQLAVDIHGLDAAQAAFMEALFAERTLEQAAETAAQHDGFDLPAAIGALIASGAFADSIRFTPADQ
jgi:hypothetical protein